MRRKADHGHRADHWIYLDRSWAQRLGVRRTAGVYRIRSRELARRLSRETLYVDISGTVHAYGVGAHDTATASRSGDQSEGVPARAGATDRRHLGG
ncbi:MAG: hypothetical protein JO364_04010 [Pseudonocardiales bacterium]|nr:hypothetical protein [Pseudonocardiales bacterium]MBV9029473.1 hypothetical protein [Pseudonocardiales bacterium]